MRYLFLMSKKAGSGYFDELEKSIISSYGENNLEYKIIKTEHKDHAKEVVWQYHDDEELIFYVCSGDGTLNEVVNEMKKVNAKFAVGLIPSGTANDFSKNFDYKNFKIEDTINPKFENIDLIKVNDRYSVNVLSFGFDTVILKTAYDLLKKNPKLGQRAYPRAVLKNIFKIPKYKLKCYVEKDGESLELEGDFLLGAICNGGYYGGGFNPSPNADVSDGVLEICLAEEMSLLKLIPLVFKYKKGKHLSHKLIYFQELTKGRIEFEKELMVNVDGEIFKTDYLDFRVSPKALKFANICNEKI
ncbi:diacylglycerol/lipid kinase family protein [Mediannikoviicoccus vaginalis]|uniref:diacylglycerol/lipid kinase family protein n=1 Tax=Mediannikoviicoccus vaginalis TaxID=2899727 RepID=UPI001F023BCC|nr:YegS/Rv2252/BmrU family lipid kinase [Mediannikoviicoccus vaginalis]